MAEFDAFGTAVIIAMVVAYILLTSWLTVLLAAAVFTSIWYVLGNPYGIDNMYVAAVTPVLVMMIERALSWPKSAAVASAIRAKDK